MMHIEYYGSLTLNQSIQAALRPWRYTSISRKGSC